MSNSIRVGSRVRHNNLICSVVEIGDSFVVLKPLGSGAQYSAPINDVTLIMNEGETSSNNPLYD
jgi:hypothetical protein